MSVKTSLNGQMRMTTKSRLQAPSLTSPEQNLQHLYCTHNSINIHKRILPNINLACHCSLNDLQSKNGQSYTSKCNFVELQIDGTNIHASKNHVKHIFTMQSTSSNKTEYVKILMPDNYDIVINSYGLVDAHGKKLVIVRETTGQISCDVYKPLEMIEQAVRLRALKLTCSQKPHDGKSLSQRKTLNINWGDKQGNSSQSSLNNSVTVPSYRNSEMQMKGSIRKANICLATCNRRISKKSLVNMDITGVQYKKSLQKNEHSHSKRQLNRKSQGKKKMLNNKNTTSLNTTHTQVLKTRNRSNQNLRKNVSGRNFQNCNPLNQSCYGSQLSQVGSTGSKCVQTKIYQKEEYENEAQISSESFYTAKKEEGLQSQRSMQQSDNKANRQVKTRTEYKKKVAQSNSTDRNHGTDTKLQDQNKNIPNNINTPGVRSFYKNISQTKIAQVSRVLIKNRKKQ